MNAHNFGTVLAFELRRTLLRPIFWLTTLSVPALMALILALSFFSQNTAIAQNEAASEGVTFTYTDASGVVVPEVAARLGGTPAPDPEAARVAVEEGRADLFISVPADPTTEAVTVVARDDGLFNSGPWGSLASRLIQDSASARIDNPQLVSLTRAVPISLELWKDGSPSGGLASAILPGFFIVLLYAAILMLGQQMLNITVEEKENRVTEMILTTINPTVLILAKVVAVIIAGIVQAAVFLIPALIWLTATGGQLIPADASAGAQSIGVSQLIIDPVAIALAALMFIGGFTLFTALLVAIGAMMPTVKDAGTAFGAVVLLMFIPLYMLPVVASDSRALVTQVLTYFPLTAPIAAQVRNAAGTLSVAEAVIALVILYVSAGVLLWLAVRLFRQGSIAYNSRLKLSSLRRSPARASA